MSAWVNHIKELAKTSGKSYSACLKDPESKKSYTPVEKKPASAKPRVKKQPLEKVEPKEGEIAKPKTPRKKKADKTIEVVYDKAVPEKKKKFKVVDAPMKLKSEHVILDGIE